ncbi:MULTISPECIES: antibiotic biosynthesis monooxygenase family protein [Desulfosediminicola]|uniref:antibiotic biosynthesis monooxygenase family protein n=1 Tax=Desulfosediminicola TaxID=2886823 RepID=UPI0010ACD387|nr:antibiotic biosynthesis monooxygenase family protein [Desulfosediminicola ganghwensis]
MVKVFIKRKVADASLVELINLLKQLRTLTLNQPGYVSGETLRRMDKEGECVVISTWRSLDDWNAWITNPDRASIQGEIDSLLGKQTEYEVYG